jgi:N-acetyl-anhydromuramyl-L-alanine amidase AmpD
MIDRTDVFKKYHPGHLRKNPVDTVVIHGTAGGENAGALFRWWHSLDTATDEWSKQKLRSMKSAIGFYHYLIDREGQTYSLLAEDRFGFHSHAGHADGTAIAIALVNPMAGNADTYTDQQYHALFTLIEDIKTRHSVTAIESHDFRAMKYSKLKTTTPCPGPLTDWSRLYVHGVEVNK